MAGDPTPRQAKWLPKSHKVFARAENKPPKLCASILTKIELIWNSYSKEFSWKFFKQHSAE